jgi:lysozyme
MTLEELLKLEENFKPNAYKDSLGIWTVGYGRNLRNKGLSRAEVIDLLQQVKVPEPLAQKWLQSDIQDTRIDLERYVKVFPALDPVRQDVLVDMAFNMGVTGLLKFQHFLLFLAQGQWNEAADAMLNSLWATQVGNRAKVLSEMIRSGRYSD